MQIGIPAEILAGETRVAATPETVKKFAALGYKVVVQPNPTDSNVKVDSLELRLKSDDGFLLDATVYSTAFRPEAVIRAGKTNVLQGTSSFNLSSRSGEGSPSDIDLSVSCKRIIPGK